MISKSNLMTRHKPLIVAVAIVAVFALVCVIAVVPPAWAEDPQPASKNNAVAADAQEKKPGGSAPEIIVYASDLSKKALSEFDFWDDPASPGGKMVGTPNTGDELDPPPENDPHVTFKVEVQQGIPYRCWVHMKVGAPKVKSQANLLWAQFANAVDKANKEVFKPGTGSYLTAQGPAQQGWSWVDFKLEDNSSEPALVYFRTSGEITVCLQAGMEGVGFDQLVLSPAQFLEVPPSEAVAKR